MAEICELALPDTGPLGNFMDLAFAIQHQIPVWPKQICDGVKLVDEFTFSLGPISQEMVPLDFWIGEHQELICFDLICFSYFSVILGTPWVPCHNSDILWGHRALHFGSTNRGQTGFLGSPLARAQIRCRTKASRLLTPLAEVYTMREGWSNSQ